MASSCRGYAVDEVKDHRDGVSALLKLKNTCRIHGPDVQTLQLDVRFETDTRIHIKLSDADRVRFEVPESVLPRPGSSPSASRETSAYDFQLGQDPFTLRVTRKSDGEVLFDTSSPGGSSLINPLIFEEQYMEISTRIPANANIFGLGEVVQSFRRDPSFTRQTMWARDAATPKSQNVYGTHPFHMEMRNGKAHGIFLLNSNGMDVLVRQETLTYKVIGGVLDFYIFSGPTPADVVHQYYEVIGYPHMIPYWVLGFHHCRYGYKNIKEVKDVIRGYREAGIPLETMWTDIDYMDQFKDFTVDPVNFPATDMRSMISDLRSHHQHYVLILDPAIKAEKGYEPYDEGQRKGIFIRKSDGRTLIGKVWPGLTAFPDFLNPDTQVYWTKWIREFMKSIPVDGWWIDMNEPANFCDGDCGGNHLQQDSEQLPMSVKRDFVDSFDPLNPSYKINNAGNEAPLKVKTVSPDALHYNNTLHYDVHNLYGHTEAIMTRQALLDIHPGKRPFVLTRSSFPGTGVHAGHWTGDNWSTWEHLYLSIPAMLNFQLFGIPLVGADICGFILDTTEELCSRWMQLGAFYPFSRNHNTINAKPQEPYLWESVTKAAKRALNVRYSLLPFYYTLFYQSHKFGNAVVRPLFFEFAEDKNVISYDRQFLIGSAVLITPVLEERASQVSGYFPAGKWYDWYTQKLVSSAPVSEKQGKWLTLDAPRDYIPVHIRGGHVVPIQIPAMTTYESRLKPFELIVALDEDQYAHGELFIDDGISHPIRESAFSYLYFKSELSNSAPGQSSLTASGIFNYKNAAKLETVYVLGLKKDPVVVSLNSRDISADKWSYDADTGKLVIKNLGIPLTKEFTLTWSEHE